MAAAAAGSNTSSRSRDSRSSSGPNTNTPQKRDSQGGARGGDAALWPSREAVVGPRETQDPNTQGTTTTAGLPLGLGRSGNGNGNGNGSRALPPSAAAPGGLVAALRAAQAAERQGRLAAAGGGDGGGGGGGWDDEQLVPYADLVLKVRRGVVQCVRWLPCCELPCLPRAHPRTYSQHTHAHLPSYPAVHRNLACRRAARAARDLGVTPGAAPAGATTLAATVGARTTRMTRGRRGAAGPTVGAAAAPSAAHCVSCWRPTSGCGAGRWTWSWRWGCGACGLTCVLVWGLPRYVGRCWCNGVWCRAVDLELEVGLGCVVEEGKGA